MEKKVFSYRWKVCYYETDAMRVVHHSNYLRWMETARVAWLDAVGLNFRKLEEEGLTSPVTGIEVSYKRPALFDDEVEIRLWPGHYDGLRLLFYYEIWRGEELLLTGLSRHCFTDLATGRVLSLPRSRPDLDRRLRHCVEGANDDEAV